MNPACAVEAQFFRLLNRIVEPRVRAGWGSFRSVPGGLIVLETTGRKTGRRSRMPLAAVRMNGYTLVSTFRGDRSGWVRNLAAHPDCRYWVGGRPRRGRAFVISSARRSHTIPSELRWLVPILLPYTYAGWAFAVLAPEEKRERTPLTERAA
jgi:deazaflavin-dependent oxidoreductase (nitroreductase family)